MYEELPVERLRRVCDPSMLPCERTEDIPPLEGIIGQERAVRALKFGLEIKERGFNIYVAGLPGTGKTTAVTSFLEELAKSKPVPSDWCYVNNFQDPYKPKALKLPAGKANQLKHDMKTLIEDARREIPKAFESEDYAARRESVAKRFDARRKERLTQLNENAKKQGFLFQTTPMGILMIPIVDGKPLSDEEFLALSPKTREKIQERREKLEVEVSTVSRQLRDIEKEMKEQLLKLNRDVALYAIGHPISDLMEKYKDLPEVTAYLKEVQEDLVGNLDQFKREPTAQQQFPFPVPWMREAQFRKYEVNVIADNFTLQGAPVIIEPNPTYGNLFGKIEKEAQFGALTTDFTMIIGGSFHKANGGYLVLPVEELLRNLFAYDSMKRAVKNSEITIEEAGERLGFITTKSLDPQAIPLDVKVVLIGNPFTYQLLYAYDPEFKELFKVKADFETRMDRTDENIRRYAAFVCTVCRKEKLKHLDASGVAKLIEYSSRLAEDQGKLSTEFAQIADIVREANFYAAQDGSQYVTASHVKKAIEEKIYRSNLIQEKIRELIEKQILLIDTSGEVVGQVNGLSVMSLGDFAFGRPSRVTASVGLGREGLIDIEREVKLGGPIHSKGVMILGGYLAAKYAQEKPLSLSARLVFEQSYEGVEGDSASSTELYAILSSLAVLPIKQDLAVTGSVNQKGEVQAIGGVNEKIEGFFEVCKAKGLTGRQGVIIPEANVQNLMLKEEVVEAVQKGKFHIYPVRTIDQGIEILTGVEAGSRREDGTFEQGTVNYGVDMRLRKMAEKLREFLAFQLEEKKISD